MASLVNFSKHLKEKKFYMNYSMKYKWKKHFPTHFIRPALFPYKTEKRHYMKTIANIFHEQVQTFLKNINKSNPAIYRKNKTIL